MEKKPLSNSIILLFLSTVLNTENEKCIQSSPSMDILPKKRKFYWQDQGELENGVVQENDSEKNMSRILSMTTGSGLSDNLSIISKQESKPIFLSDREIECQ